MLTPETSRNKATEEPPLIGVRDLSVTYTRDSGTWRDQIRVKALGGIDLDVRAGSILAVVGESGGGKSTLARCLALLEKPSAGEIRVAGRRVDNLAEKELRKLRPRFQLISQDPAAAVHPRWAAAKIVSEPLRIARPGEKARHQRRALELMEEVGLGRELADRRAGELSGGQKQRLVIARALAAEPKLLILDEALSSLDLSLQAQIVNLLLGLRRRLGLTYVFISHDLRMARYLADTVVVIQHGRLVAHTGFEPVLPA